MVRVSAEPRGGSVNDTSINLTIIISIVEMAQLRQA